MDKNSLDSLAVLARIVGRTGRLKLALLVLLMVLVAFSELITIGAVVPFTTVLLNISSASPSFHSTLFTQYFVNHVSPDSYKFLLILVFSLIVLMAAGLRIILLWAATRVSADLGVLFTTHALEGELAAPFQVLNVRHSGDVLANIRRTEELVVFVIQPVLSIVSGLVVVMIIAGFLLWVSPLTTGIVLGSFVSVYLFLHRAFRARLYRQGLIMSSSHSSLIRLIQETMGSIRDIKIEESAVLHVSEFRRMKLVEQNARVQSLVIAQSPRYLIEAIATLALIFVLGYFSLQGTDAVFQALPLFAATALGGQRLLPVGQQIFNGFATLRAGRPILNDALPILAAQRLSYRETRGADRKGESVDFKLLQLTGITFSYSKGKKNILTEFGFEIASGEFVALKGPSGRGKSTLLDIIAGLLEPQAGVVLLNGEKLPFEGRAARMREFLTHVPQKIFLLDDTVEKNIIFSRGNVPVDQKRLREVMELTGADQVDSDIQQRGHRFVGENGSSLSGGQVQRIGIARALYRGSPILVLDEATSALDEKSEKDIIDGIISSGLISAVILVTHRDSTLRFSTRVVNL